jgi:hypothetical protein
VLCFCAGDGERVMLRVFWPFKEGDRCFCLFMGILMRGILVIRYVVRHGGQSWKLMEGVMVIEIGSLC